MRACVRWVQMQEAQRRIVPLGEAAEHIPHCQYIIEHSTSPYAQVVGAQSLTRLITTHWTSFAVSQRADIRTCAMPADPTPPLHHRAVRAT